MVMLVHTPGRVYSLGTGAIAAALHAFVHSVGCS